MKAYRSFLAGALAVLLIVGGGAGYARAESAFLPSAVTFKVDDAKKTINVTVKLAFYNRTCGAGASCEVPAGDVSRIVKAIEDMWNNGSKVKCYTFVVKVDARVVGSQSEAGQAEVDVGLDYGPVPVRAFVHGVLHGVAASDPLSNSPDQRVEAAHDPASPTTWPSKTYDQTYAHEFGHILGLDDNYDKAKSGFPVKGASDDLMFRKQGTVTDEMVKRVVERSGEVKLADLKCGLVTESHVDPIEWYGDKCDDVDGEWLVRGQTASGGLIETWIYDAIVDPKTFQETYKYEALGSIPGGTFRKNGSGRASTAAQPDGSVVLKLDGTVVTGTITAAGTTQTVSLPVPAAEFTWKRATGSQCA